MLRSCSSLSTKILDIRKTVNYYFSGLLSAHGVRHRGAGFEGLTVVIYTCNAGIQPVAQLVDGLIPDLFLLFRGHPSFPLLL